jgi:peptidoglycan-associated lipoprotein
MKCTKFINLTAATLLLAVVAGVGCQKRVQGPTPLPGYGKTGVTGESPTGPIGDGPGPTGIPVPDNLKDLQPDPNQPPALRDNTIFFAYDRSDIRSSETSKLDAIASFMKGMPNRAVRVEGHADARGTEEYNRALGEKRALSAREYLVRAGLSANLIDTISHGEDKPAVQGNNDAAWSKNRRAEFLLLQAPTGVGASGTQ